MKHIIAVVILACLPALGLAGPTMTLRLIDGSLVTGEMLSYGSGVYRIRSETLGLLEIPEDRVATLVPPGSDAGANSSSGDNSGQISHLQTRIVQDGDLMSLVMQLQNDPSMQAVLSDPEVLQAIAGHDLQALQANPAIQKLMAHPVIQQIFSQLR